MDARQVFEQMTERNLVTWSSMISMYTQHNHAHEALVFFSRFRVCSNGSPNEFILASVMRGCTQLKWVKLGTQVHGVSVKIGFDEDVFVGTSLIDFYSKNGNGDIRDAWCVFVGLPVKNSVTWTAIIAGYSQSGRSDVSLRLFSEMRETGGVVADRYVISSVVSACSMLGFLEGGKQIHGYVLRNETKLDISVINVLIDLYSKCGRVRDGRKLFDQMSVKNIVSWTTMIAGYMQNSYDWDAMELFSAMNRLGWRGDGFACTSILSSCGSLQALEHGRQVHAYSVKANLESNEFVKNGLIDMYAKCGFLKDARRSLDVMTECNVVSYNAMMEGYARGDMFYEALNIFHEMRLSSIHPSLLTFVSLLGVSASLSTIDLSKQIHGLIIKFGFSLDLYAGSALVDVYSKCFCAKDARLVFDEMNEKDIVVWNAMIFGYTLNTKAEDAFRIFLELQRLRMKPNEFTFVALVTVASNMASLAHGQQFHSQLIKIGLDLEPFITNALVDLYAKCGSIEEAQKMFNTEDQKDVVCWNSIISRYAQHGHAEEALQMFDRMRAEGIVPNYVTFVGVLSACSHVGLVESGLRHFDSMISEFGVDPGMEHYACVVALLGRAGKLCKAKEFIERMPIEPATVVWRSLLSACSLAGDVIMGKYAAEKAILLDPKDSGSYILFSNILASKGMWGDVEDVRKRMTCNEVPKEPGHTWI
ncbi:hypothetical protein GIB67_026078 [Kingdonia uniflora]|uniref:Pentatricopeptide repeat-containing protein n=1 Tax=Kingdonia uniflora TaxID=39325 RepID=A0A7J7M301_9MAGN|nr:hypothetical protein GIB67_026078 [Kingdonia uniflora]